MTPEERVVIAELRATIRERTSPRGARQGISLRELDRMIGKEGQGWTSKFLRESDEFPGVPSIGTLLAVLFALHVEPAQFFERAFPPDRPERTRREISTFLKHVETELPESVERLIDQRIRENIAPLVKEELSKLKKKP
jgi:transcriptional regulator with XRE-family HTH domain